MKIRENKGRISSKFALITFVSLLSTGMMGFLVGFLLNVDLCAVVKFLYRICDNFVLKDYL